MDGKARLLKVKLNTAKNDFDRAFRELLFVADRIHAEDHFDLSIKSRRCRTEIERVLNEANRKVERG